jgi:hypothetical protein
MNQLTIPLTPDFAASLASLMQARGVTSPEEAVKLAVRETVEKVSPAISTDFKKWIGLACQVPEDPNARFKSDDDLWE